MNQTVVNEISGNLLFRYRIPCSKIKEDTKKPVELPPSTALTDFGNIDADSGESFAQVRAAWGPSGMYVWLKVQGKKQSVWCRKTQLMESDGLHIWLDTRDTHNVHRATRYCHWFLCLPAGADGNSKGPIATMLKINRAKEHSPNINQFPVAITSKIIKSGYSLAAFIPGNTINGWDTNEHRLIGFNYMIMDRELGTHTLGLRGDFPVSEDPSLWHTLVLKG